MGVAHFEPEASVRVPSRFPNTMGARSAPRTPSRYVAGSGGRIGVWPSIVSPTAAIVTDRRAEDDGDGEGLGDGDGGEGAAAAGGGELSLRVTAQAIDAAATAPARRRPPTASRLAPPAGP